MFLSSVIFLLLIDASTAFVEFNWEDVKADKHRENYLGHSVKAPVGRWQKGRDLYWYTKEHGSGGPTKEEIKRIQEEEEDAMKEMLGLAPRKNKRPQGNQLDRREVDELLKRGKGGEEQAPAYVDGERVQGLGFAPAPGQTGGEAGGKRTVEVKRNDVDVSLPLEQISSGRHVDEVEKDVVQRTLPPSEYVATCPGKSPQEGAVSSEDETASQKRREEKRKTKELRREAKRARREASKASKGDSGQRNKDERLDSSRVGRHEDKGRRRHERKEVNPEYQRKGKEERYVKARYERYDSDGNGGKAGRLSMGHNNRRKVDYVTTCDGEHSKPYMKYRRSESPDHRSRRIRRQDADRERKAEKSLTSS